MTIKERLNFSIKIFSHLFYLSYLFISEDTGKLADGTEAHMHTYTHMDRQTLKDEHIDFKVPRVKSSNKFCIPQFFDSFQTSDYDMPSKYLVRLLTLIQEILGQLANIY